MGVNWTKEQQQVIDLRDRNILVSAAAGSGKTAVLVERIITRLTETEDPIDVDRLLIVTFTEAAAAEMKERIRGAIEKALEERPADEHLQRQATLIHTAQITTIHSFCLSVIREHFHTIDLDPGFRIGEEGELKLLKRDVLDKLLDAKYEEGSRSFLEFAEAFSGGRDDKKIEELILQIYDYSRSYPQPKEWLSSCLAAYQEPKEGQEAPFIERGKTLVRQYLRDARQILVRGIELCEQTDGPYMYKDMLESDLLFVQDMEGAATFEQMYEAAKAVAWKRLSTKKDEAVSPKMREEVKALREEVKSLVKDVCTQYFYDKPAELLADLKKCYGPMLVLTGLVEEFSCMFAEQKSSKNVIDFGDMEQFALQILTKEEGGKLVPSMAAKEYQSQFLEVMIDEYQDSNLIQEAILTSVSTVSTGKNNVFMVGDVKQSIYRFRLSRPELFMEKFDTYSLEDSDAQRIDLHKNFRSRSEVLDSTNFICRQIMTKSLGGIDYDDRAALYLGAGYETQTDGTGESINKTEVLVVDTEVDEEGDAEEVTETVRELEARAIALRIKELMVSGRVLDKSTNTYRPVTYRDIVILTRSVKGWSDVFSTVLNEEGIPTYAGKTEGYFETFEVSLLLDYLKVLDNLRQDLPLAAVLTSPFVGLTAEELAGIRREHTEQPFFEAVTSYINREKEDRDEALEEKIKRAIEQITYFRKQVPHTAIHELLFLILQKTGYYDYISAMPGGEQRKANVDMLVEKAIAFEGTSYKGLFNFVRYMEQLQKYDVDYGEASITDEQTDTVRLMSIHKSKGLEFPIVFVAGMNKRFNKQDVTGSVVIHPKWGIGIDAVDLERRTKAPTLLKKMIQREVLLENLGEELRVLYVALTRAKEKLIMIGTLPKAKEKLEKYESLRQQEEGPLSFTRLSKAVSYFDWVLPSLARLTPDIPMECICMGLEQIVAKETAAEEGERMAEEVLLHWNKEQTFDAALREQLKEQLDFVYPYEKEGELKLKFTVSELKKRNIPAEEPGEVLYEEPETVPLVPEFMQEKEELTGASRGSAYHKLLELIDFSKEYDAAVLKSAVQIFCSHGKLSKEMAACIDIEDILTFLHSRTGARMCRAAQCNLLRAEQPFVLGVDASEIYPGETGGETILVQGIIDAYFEEEEELVVLDYKTDQVRDGAELAKKYHAQLDYYAKALEQLLGKRVKEKLIYSFTLQEEIEV